MFTAHYANEVIQSLRNIDRTIMNTKKKCLRYIIQSRLYKVL